MVDSEVSKIVGFERLILCPVVKIFLLIFGFFFVFVVFLYFLILGFFLNVFVIFVSKTCAKLFESVVCF